MTVSFRFRRPGPWSQDFTVKSNARRAAKKAKIDPSTVQAFVKAGKTLYRYPTLISIAKPRGGVKRMKKVQAASDARMKRAAETIAARKAAKKATRAASLRKAAGKPVDGLAAATGEPRQFKAPAKPRPLAGSVGNKFETVATMLRRPGGASMTEVVAITGWKPHSARARISVDVSKLLDKGEVIERRRQEGVSWYAIVPSKQLDLPIAETKAA